MADRELPQFLFADNDVRPLRIRIGRAAVWSTTMTLFSQSIGLVTRTILARLLGPAEFGVVSMALLVSSSVVVLRDFGLTSALIQREDIQPQHATAAFWFSTVVSLGLAGLVILSAPPVAAFFGQPLLTPILRILAPSFVLSAMASVHIAMLQRSLGFRLLAIGQLSAEVSYGLVAILLALSGYGVWALVVGILVREMVRCLVFWQACRWRPTVRFHRHSLLDLWDFGGSMFATKITLFVRQSFDQAVIGKLLGATEFGVYIVAFNLAMLPRVRILPVFNRVMFPSLSRVQDNMERMHQLYLKMLELVAWVLLPMSIGAIVVARDLVLLVYGEKWLAMVLPFQVMCLGAAISPLAVTISNLLLANGHSRAEFRLTMVTTAAFVVLVLVGVRWGVVGVSVAVVAELLFFLAIKVLAVKRILGLSVQDYFGAWARPAAGSAIMAMIVTLFKVSFLSQSVSIWLRLLTVVVLGALVYIGWIAMFGQQIVLLGWRTLKPLTEEAQA